MISKYIYKDKLVLRDGIWCADDLDELSFPKGGYDILYKIEDESYWFKHRNRCIIELAKRYPPPENVIFDVGGGNGVVSKELSEVGFRVVLVEPGISGALNAKKRGGFDVVCAMFNKDSFQAQSVGGVALFDVLEHVWDDAGFLCECNALMRSDSRIYISVPAYPLLWSNSDTDACHFRRYTNQSLIKLVKNSGFEVLFCSFFFSYLPLPIFLRRSLPFRFGIRKNIQEQSNRELAPTLGKSVSDVLDIFLKFETKCIRNGEKMPFGASLLLTAQKK